MESFDDGVVVFDSYGRVVFANTLARRIAGLEGDLGAQRADALRPRLLALGGRLSPLRSGGLNLGEAIFLSGANQPSTLADRERQAIVDTLHGTHGKLAETARRLGISRTTLWRRLKAYGLRPGNGRSGPPRT
jgi:transcriptional regulator of acetoin/glycerol metabolism